MIDERLKTRVQVKAGPQMVGVTFIRSNAAESDEPLQPHERDHDLQNMNGIPLIDHVNITGPFKRPVPATRRAGAGSSRAARRMPPRKPACARKILSTLARRAYRRPVTERRT